MSEDRCTVSYFPLLFTFNPKNLLSAFGCLNGKRSSSILYTQRVWGLILLCLLVFSCQETSTSEYQLGTQYLTDTVLEQKFWNQIDTVHVLIASERFAQAKAKLLKARSLAENQAQHDIMSVIAKKLTHLERNNREILSANNPTSDPYLRSLRPADLMLTYNYAANYLSLKIGKEKEIEFPGPLIKRQHIVFFDGAYMIKSYADVVSAYDTKRRIRFSCCIKLLKDRKSYVIDFLEVII